MQLQHSAITPAVHLFMHPSKISTEQIPAESREKLIMLNLRDTTPVSFTPVDQYKQLPVKPITELETIPFEQNKRIQTEVANSYNATKKLSVIDKSNKTLYITKELRCVCPDTGIVFYCHLPSPLGAKVVISHPFSLYNNVVKMIKEYQKAAMPIAKLDRSVLAGMLITVMREKGFSYCREPITANAAIVRINRKTLVYALDYFYKASERANNPTFCLDSLTDRPTEQLLSYLQVCRGEDSTLLAHHMLERKYNTVRGKVLVNQDDKEASQLKQDVKECRGLLEKLAIEKPISKELYHSIELRIKGIGYLTEKGKAKLTEDFYSLFGENDSTNAFFYIVNSNQTNEVSKDLLSFSQEVHQQDAKEPQTGKIDFKALMGWNKE